jgi:hypothetical protein
MHLTYRNDSEKNDAAYTPHAGEAGAPSDDVEITPEMIEAGVDAISKIHWEMDRFDEMAASIYMAMITARKPSRTAA